MLGIKNMILSFVFVSVFNFMKHLYNAMCQVLAKFFSNINLFNPYNNSLRSELLLSPILYRRELRLNS